MGCLWSGKYSRQCKTMSSGLPEFIPLTRMTCSYGKISSPLTEISVHGNRTEITVNGNTAPKIIAGSWSYAKRIKMAEKPQKIGKEVCQKDWLNKEMEEFQKPGEHLAKTEGWKYSPKTRGFRPKREGWNFCFCYAQSVISFLSCNWYNFIFRLAEYCLIFA